MKAEEVAVPLVDERAQIGKRVRETGRVRVRTAVERREELVEAELAHEEVEIERVPMRAPVDAVPPVRQEGDVTIIPVVEEELIVETRLVVVEEIRLRRTRRTERITQPVTLAAQRAEVAREETSGEQA